MKRSVMRHLMRAAARATRIPAGGAASGQRLVRALVTELLEELGYAVEALGSAEEALPVLSTQSFDLLLTDVVLPGLNGRQFAEIGRQSRPSLPVLFMTGYAHSAVTRGEFLSDGMTMIAKPFSLVSLSEAVDAILGMASHTK